MERAFQTALWLLKPHIVFILGDIFDEGTWSSEKDWEDDVRRFSKMFRRTTDTELIVLPGNHDVGFQNEADWAKLWRFEKVFNVTSATVVTKGGVNFLLLNSMAVLGGSCSVCRSVEDELFLLSRDLNCSLQVGASQDRARGSGPPATQSKKVGKLCRDARKFPSSPPIILQHYPLYRASNAICSGLDVAPEEVRHQRFEEQYDTLSQEASEKVLSAAHEDRLQPDNHLHRASPAQLLWWFRPRLVLSGHIHRSCAVLHENKYPEVSVSSFNWRNGNRPSFLLGSFSPDRLALSTCFLPEETTVVVLYCGSGAAVALLALLRSYLLKGTSLVHRPPV
ncbi:metallophosphoesterase 1-like [Scleropages formosus]|uniref:Metallophosphoesterase 1 n=1 Tax=Scleropages formosus TaxID=113540 RepID=A0A0P7TJS0_SCLFO|nr:metallophosphoesterase 1-like [Scleropages formosus]